MASSDVKMESGEDSAFVVLGWLSSDRSSKRMWEGIMCSRSVGVESCSWMSQPGGSSKLMSERNLELGLDQRSRNQYGEEPRSMDFMDLTCECMISSKLEDLPR